MSGVTHGKLGNYTFLKETYNSMRQVSLESPFITPESILSVFFEDPNIASYSHAVIRLMEVAVNEVTAYREDALQQLCLDPSMANLLRRQHITRLHDVLYNHDKLVTIRYLGKTYLSRINSDLQLLFPHLFLPKPDR